MDPELRKVDRYLDFLAKRRVLLAESANEFLSSLLHGNIEEKEIQDFINRDTVPVAKIPDNYNEEDEIIEVSEWMEQKGLNPGEIYYELTDDTGALLTTIDIAWPDGIQTGLSEPVALLLNESAEVHEIVNNAGYHYFTDVDTFKQYVDSYIA